MKKRIGIDCRLAGGEHAGIGRYTQNLIQRLVVDKNHEWVLFFNNQKQADEILSKVENHVKIVILPVRHYSLKEQFVLPVAFLREKLDLLHIPHFNIPILYPGKIVVTIHDLLWHEQRGSHVTTLPAWKYWLKYWAYKLTVQKAVDKPKVIFVPSKTVAKTIEKYYPQAKSKTVVTYEGIDDSFLKANLESKTIKKQLVYTGSLYPHKNIEVVFKALKKLPDFSLKLVGSRNIFQEETLKLAEKHDVKNQVDFLGRLSDEKLINLYQKSFALIFPSLSEGFGLPGLEAMAVNLPVIASDIPIFKEIYGESAAYFSPSSVEELIETILILEPSRKELINSGQKTIKKYDWQKMVDQTVDEYNKQLKN